MYVAENRQPLPPTSKIHHHLSDLRLLMGNAMAFFSVLFCFVLWKTILKCIQRERVEWSVKVNSKAFYVKLANRWFSFGCYEIEWAALKCHLIDLFVRSNSLCVRYVHKTKRNDSPQHIKTPARTNTHTHAHVCKRKPRTQHQCTRSMFLRFHTNWKPNSIRTSLSFYSRRSRATMLLDAVLLSCVEKLILTHLTPIRLAMLMRLQSKHWKF